MTWDQHRFAIERAARMRRAVAKSINNHCVECDTKLPEGDTILTCACPEGPTFAGVTLQGEANGSDAEMLDEVAEFLKSLEGYRNENGSIGFLQGKELAEAFGRDMTAACLILSTVALKYSLPMPALALDHRWEPMVRTRIATMRLGEPLPYAGVEIRFGHYRQVTAFV